MDFQVRETTYGQGDQKWLGSAHGTEAILPITLDLSLFDDADHYPDGFLPSGLALGKVTATGVYGPYDDALATGVQTLVGHLFESVNVASDNTAGKAVGGLFMHGFVREANLPDNHGVDAAGKVDAAGRLIYL
jgi:hypothetical protein